MSKDFFALENAALAGGATKEEYQQFVAYVAGFYGNLSNYHSFGHMKFIPECSPEAFKKILMSNPMMNDSHAGFYKKVIEDLYP
jgi:hypothetical protein